MRFRPFVSAAVLVFAAINPVAAQSAIDAAALAEARTLMEKSGVGGLARQLARLSLQQQRTLLEQANPGRAAAIAEIQVSTEAEIDKQLPTPVDAFARLNILHFSTKELGELVAFYDSPLGRKLVKERPAIMAEGVALGQAFGHKVADEVMRALVPELEKRNLESGPSRT